MAYLTTGALFDIAKSNVDIGVARGYAARGLLDQAADAIKGFWGGAKKKQEALDQAAANKAMGSRSGGITTTHLVIGGAALVGLVFLLKKK